MDYPPAIVLVEPAGPLNLGSVARVMKNFGLHDLRLVHPHCTPQAEEAQRMAVHAQEVLADARVYDTLPLALADRERVVGTTARSRALETETTPEEALRWVQQGGPGAIVFGPEDRGLSNAELDYCQRWLTLPTNPVYPSLNLAQAVGICCFLTAQTPSRAPTTQTLAAAQTLEGFYEQWAETLLAIGYLQPHTRARRMTKFRRLFNRAGLTEEEVALLRGVLRQMHWASTQGCAPELETEE
ncbi:RNA methyltransferase [Anthocerotibacter panamensis]|uniref:RNA methyltransferase n=1 Tax=Anthocerotibacter panamensis TaxID=2857077 RepID=UPI001C401C03|nr:RNA methyltransferase [Anthocerotibacter panamensis]